MRLSWQIALLRMPHLERHPPADYGLVRKPRGEGHAKDTALTMAQNSLFDTRTRVVKSNQLIQSRMAWTKLEHRVVAMMIAQLQKEDDRFTQQRVYIKDLADLTGRSGKSLYDQAEEICQKLLDQKVHVREVTEDGRRHYKGYNCMSSCEYIEGSGYILAKFNDDMRPLLLQLKERFTQYKLRSFMRLSSQYSMRIYELLKMREGLRFLRISMQELREILCCEDSYKRFVDFRRFILDKSREELKEKTDIYFNYQVERKGQRPVRITFVIKQTEDDAPSKNGTSTSNGEEKASRNGRSFTDPELIQAASSDRVKDVGVKPNGSNAEMPHFNVVAMVLDEMSQEELDERSSRDIRNAVEEAEQRVRKENPDDGAARQAVEAYQQALRLLRSG